MKKILWFSLFSVICLVLGSCGSSKNIAYFKNADSLSYLASKGLFDAKIMPKDFATSFV